MSEDENGNVYITEKSTRFVSVVVALTVVVIVATICWAIVRVAESKAERRSDIVEQCATVENEVARTFCVTES